jgi:outer membrane protein assembly factor BamB
VADYSFGLHAYDAKTGELKWTRGGSTTVNGNSAPVGPVISGSVVVYQNAGLDLQTGKELWKVPHDGSPRRMIIGDKERVLLVGSQATSLIDPADGKALWTSDVVVKDNLNTVSMPVCEDDKMVAYAATINKETGKVVDKQAGRVVAYTVSDAGIQRAWESDPCTWDENLFMGISKGRVYAAMREEGLRCLDLASGKTLASIPTLKCGSNASLIIVDDRVFYQPEGQHGGQEIHLVDAINFKELGAKFVPPHNVTTAYGQMPLSNVVVDGRLITRGLDGVYCYDLRAAAK